MKNVTQLTTFFYKNCKRITCKEKDFISRIIDIYIILPNLQTYYISYFTYREKIFKSVFLNHEKAYLESTSLYLVKLEVYFD